MLNILKAVKMRLHPGCYESALHFPPPELPLTALQMSWLAALIHAPRFRALFYG